MRKPGSGSGKLYTHAIVRGLGKLFDFGGCLTEYEELYVFRKDADERALLNDRARVGDDLRAAVQAASDELGSFE